MYWPPPQSTCSDTSLPYTTLFRSGQAGRGSSSAGRALRRDRGDLYPERDRPRFAGPAPRLGAGPAHLIETAEGAQPRTDILGKAGAADRKSQRLNSITNAHLG